MKLPKITNPLSIAKEQAVLEEEITKENPDEVRMANAMKKIVYKRIATGILVAAPITLATYTAVKKLDNVFKDDDTEETDE